VGIHLEAITYVVDENLIRVARALQLLRADVAYFGDDAVRDLVPLESLDTEWIPLVAVRGWVVVTDDRRLRTRPIEANLAREHGLKVIHLYKAGNLSPWDQAVQLLSHWPKVASFHRDHPSGPWWLSVRKSMIRVQRFEPGAIER